MVCWLSNIPILGKKVVVQLIAGPKRFGILKSINQQVLILMFEDGAEKYIPVQNVESITLDEKMV